MANSGMAKLISWFTVIIALIIGLVGVFSFYRYYEFQQAFAKLKASGAPCGPADLQHDVSNPADDAMTYLARLGERPVSFRREFSVDLLDGDSPIDELLIKKFEEVNAAYPDVFELLEMAANAPDTRAKIGADGNLEFKILPVQSGLNILGIKARILIAQGKPEEATDVVMTMFKLSQHCDSQPSLLGHLLANAGRIMAINVFHDLTIDSASDEMRNRVNEHLELLNSVDAYIRALETERAWVLGFQVEESNPLIFALTGKAYLDSMATAIERGRQPFTISFPEQGRKTSTAFFMGAHFGDADTYNSLRQAEGRVQCIVRSLRIINALQSEAANQIDQPVTPEYLIGLGVPKEMTLDPFTGELMKINRIDGQWHVYSLGPAQRVGRDSADDVRTEFGLVPKTAAESE